MPAARIAKAAPSAPSLRAGRAAANPGHGGEAEEPQDQHQADDAELGHRLEEERVSVADRPHQRAVLVPVGLVPAGADPVQRVGLESIERRGPELIAAAPAAAAQVRRHVGALRLHRRDLLELLPPTGGPGDENPRDGRDHDRHGDQHASTARARRAPPSQSSTRNRKAPTASTTAIENASIWSPWAAAVELESASTNSCPVGCQGDEQRPADPSDHEAPQHPRPLRAQPQEHGEPDQARRHPAARGGQIDDEDRQRDRRHRRRSHGDGSGVAPQPDQEHDRRSPSSRRGRSSSRPGS